MDVRWTSVNAALQQIKFSWIGPSMEERQFVFANSHKNIHIGTHSDIHMDEWAHTHPRDQIQLQRCTTPHVYLCSSSTTNVWIRITYN